MTENEGTSGSLTEMYCPQCGRELDLDAGSIRFCRYCGFSLADTKEALQGYSEQKRTGFSIVTLSYVLLLIVTLLLHGRYVSLDTGWIYWLLTISIVVSASCFISAAVSALKPSLFSKVKGRNKRSPGPVESANALRNPQGHANSSLPPSAVPVTNLSNQAEVKKPVGEPLSIVEGTTRRLNERNDSG